MTYSIGGLIQALDYNGFASTATPNVNQVWATGSGNSGYGQPTLSSVTAGQTITAAHWSSLFNAIIKSGAHQGTTLGAFNNPNPLPGEVISYESNLSSNIVSIFNQRLNAASQGGTSTTTATSTSTWSDAMTVTFTVSFASANAARYFFNSGGQFGLTFSHPMGVGINTVFNTIASGFGTIWLSSPTSGTVSLSGTNYSGVTQIGGSLANSTIYSNKGFYALNSSTQELARHIYTGGGGYYYYYYYGNDSYISVRASYNGSGVVTVTVLWDEVPPGYAVSTGSQTTLVVKTPNSTYLSNSWGTPVVSSSIAYS
jgi:hypothetical protein